MQPSRRSSLFLLELMIAILFFTIAAAICVQVFVKSHSLENKSMDLNQAILASASVAEILKSDADSDAILTATLSAVKTDSGKYQIYYDKFWDNTVSDDAVYVLEVHISEENSFQTGEISVYKDLKAHSEEKSVPIYELTVRKYIQEEGTGHEN